jgi:ubiquinone/menaquinone biosynthesis C-methylase UbiE
MVQGNLQVKLSAHPRWTYSGAQQVEGFTLDFIKGAFVNNEQLKQQVHDYWNKQSCGTEHTNREKLTASYFAEIEAFRYTIEPEIFSFAQFTRWRNKKVLEVGVGAATDFVQWVRAGAQAYGIDLTQEAITNANARLALEGLQPVEIQVADAEKLPYADNNFDLVYSWGVIHHSPNTEQCFKEIVRVCKPGGTIKVMIYNRHSLFAVYRWVLAALFKGKPFRSLKDVLFHDQESPGTKAYTLAETRNILKELPVTINRLEAPATAHDLLYYKSKPIQKIANFIATLWGRKRCGWFLLIECTKKS